MRGLEPSLKVSRLKAVLRDQGADRGAGEKLGRERGTSPSPKHCLGEGDGGRGVGTFIHVCQDFSTCLLAKNLHESAFGRILID